LTVAVVVKALKEEEEEEDGSVFPVLSCMYEGDECNHMSCGAHTCIMGTVGWGPECHL
jgi:hypothetical protein